MANSKKTAEAAEKGFNNLATKYLKIKGKTPTQIINEAFITRDVVPLCTEMRNAIEALKIAQSLHRVNNSSKL
jgi:hypothetical protein